MSESVCIYCPRKSETQFPREHVLPKSFGKFKCALTIRCVCGACNNYFSTHLELFLGRDSHESYRRLEHRMKPRSEAAELRGSRVVIKVAEGSWAGARVVLDYDNEQQKLVIIPLPQVAFKKPGEDWVWFEEAQLTGADVIAKFKSKDMEIKIFGSPEEQKRLSEKLASFGINFGEDLPLESPTGSDDVISLQFRSDVDRTICRAIAKIAFNYLAYVKRAEFALRPDFDSIRSFVRFDVLKGALPVNLSTKPILFDDTPGWKRTHGHLISLEWDRTGNVLICKVSLFNTLTYEVYLCQKFAGVWHDIASGHHFEIQSLTVSPLKSARITIPIRRRG